MLRCDMYSFVYSTWNMNMLIHFKHPLCFSSSIFFNLWQVGEFAQWSLVVLITSVTPSSPETLSPPNSHPATHTISCPVTHWVIRLAAWALPGIVYWRMGNFSVATPLKKPLGASSPLWAAPHLWQNVCESSLVKVGSDSHSCDKFIYAVVLLYPADVFLCMCPFMLWLLPSSLWF